MSAATILPASFIEMMSPLASIFYQYIGSFTHAKSAAIIYFLVTWSFLVHQLSPFIRNCMLPFIEVHSGDKLFDYLMRWLSRRGLIMKSRSSVAATRTEDNNIWLVERSEVSNHDNDDDDDGVTATELANTDFDVYWAGRIQKDRMRKLHFLPCNGRNYWFKYNGIWMIVWRSSSESHMMWRTTRSETLCIASISWDNSHIKHLLSEAQRLYVGSDRDKSIIYRFDNDNEYWTRCGARKRSLSTVTLDPKQKNSIVRDLRDYFHPTTRSWYANRGIPYRKGYLFYGPPGTGKTSLCIALATTFKLDIYVCSLASKNLTEGGLTKLFQNIPERSFVLLEDIDAITITHRRDHALEPAGKGRIALREESGISLSGLLNAIDGIASAEGYVLIMTTNHVEKLDEALIRPGRVDMRILFQKLTPNLTRDLFESMYKTETDGNEAIRELAEDFAGKIPPNRFSAADVQNYLLKYRSTPKDAIANVRDWVQSTVANAPEEHND